MHPSIIDRRGNLPHGSTDERLSRDRPEGMALVELGVQSVLANGQVVLEVVDLSSCDWKLTMTSGPESSFRPSQYRATKINLQWVNHQRVSFFPTPWQIATHLLRH